MSCAQARLTIGADPEGSAAALEEHLRDCAFCRQFREEMRTLDANIRRALERPPQLASTPRFSAKWRPWALAASVLLAMVAVLSVWLLRPSDTLAHEVVGHVFAAGEGFIRTRVNGDQVSARSALCTFIEASVDFIAAKPKNVLAVMNIMRAGRNDSGALRFDPAVEEPRRDAHLVVGAAEEFVDDRAGVLAFQVERLRLRRVEEGGGLELLLAFGPRSRASAWTFDA